MAINFNGNKVSHITQNGKYVTSLEYNKKTVWAEKIGTYTTGTLASTLKSLECTRTASEDPNASIGKLSDGDVLYYGDTLSFTGKTKAGHDAHMTYKSRIMEGNSNLTDSNREQTFNGVGLSGISAYKNITIKCGTGVSSAKIEYLNLRRTATTSTSVTISEIIDATKETVWTATGVESGYALPLTTGTFVAGYPDDITYTVSAEPYSWKKVIDDDFIDFAGTLHFTSAGNISWFTVGGMTRYEKVRVSGTYKLVSNRSGVAAKTGSFSNISLASDASSNTTICSDSILVSGVGSVTFTATMKHNVTLTTTVTFNEPYSSVIKIKELYIYITSVEVYVPFYFYDAYEFDTNAYGFELIRSGSKSYGNYTYNSGKSTHYYLFHEARYLNVSGNCAWSSETYASLGVFKNLGTISNCYNLDNIDATVIGAASDGQQNLSQYSLGFAISDSITGYMVSTMVWVQNVY